MAIYARSTHGSKLTDASVPSSVSVFITLRLTSCPPRISWWGKERNRTVGVHHLSEFGPDANVVHQTLFLVAASVCMIFNYHTLTFDYCQVRVVGRPIRHSKTVWIASLTSKRSSGRWADTSSSPAITPTSPYLFKVFMMQNDNR